MWSIRRKTEVATIVMISDKHALEFNQLLKKREIKKRLPQSVQQPESSATIFSHRCLISANHSYGEGLNKTLDFNP